MSRFIVLEGIDGSGKSSIADFMSGNFEQVHLTKEPTDSEIGKLAQEIANRETSPYLDLFLYLADRVDHTERIRKKLDEGTTVICDRYWGSTAAYQSAHEDITLEYAEQIQRPFIFKPSLTLLLDLDPKTALDRISDRDIKSKYEEVEFLQTVRENYLTLAKKHDWIVLDAEKEMEDVKEEISEIIEGSL
ncbi:MAG: dTMP kinase [Candidatus Thermoplasmatota archaeon]|nr:dTMP kinase [Candidatus Thermoplasmatota archaeon]